MRIHRILRDPEGGDSAGTATASAETQPLELEGQEPSADGSQTQDKPAAQAPQAPAKNKGKILAELLKKPKNYQATNDELDILDEHWAGKLKPDSGEDPEGEEEPVPDDKPPEPKPKAEKPAGNETLTELQKELGAKTVEEILPKLRDLKKLTGTRDAQAAARFERELTEERRQRAVDQEATKSELQLWEDVKKGVPKAIEYLEQKVALARQRHNLPARAPQGEQGRQGQQGAQGGGAPTFIDRTKFTFPEEADALNDALGSQFGEMRGLIQQQAETIRQLQEKDGKRDQEHLFSKAQSDQFEETMSVASLIPELKNVPGLRDKVVEWIRNPEAVIPELSVLQEVMDIANQNKANLRIAWDSLEARRLRGQVAKAKDEGVRSAYDHKPNQSLSNLQGKGGVPYTNYTDTQLRAMERDHTLIPDAWFGKDGNLDEKAMPEKARKLLLPTEERD